MQDEKSSLFRPTLKSETDYRPCRICFASPDWGGGVHASMEQMPRYTFANTPRLRLFAIMVYALCNQSELSTVAPVRSVRDLGIFVDSDLVMHK